MFLGFRIQRRRRGDGRRVVLTFPPKDALARVMHKIKEATRAGTTSLRLCDVLWKINPILRGWSIYCVSRGHARLDWRAVGLMV